MDYLFHILVLAGIYTTLAYALDLLAGHTGLLSVAHAAFYALGAYTSALLAVHCGAPFLVGVFAGAAVAFFVSLVISLPFLRLHGDYFVVATFGFQMMLSSIFTNWTTVTRGPLGVSGIPNPRLFGLEVGSIMGYAMLACTLAIIVRIVVGRMTEGAFGRVLRAIREDETFAQALGKNTFRFKILAFTISAATAACAGALYAHYVTYIDPSSFTVMESILVTSMVIIGGAGSPWGPLVGAVILVMIPEALRFLGLSGSVAANLQQMLYGTMLVLMMLFRPRGLVGRYGFGR